GGTQADRFRETLPAPLREREVALRFLGALSTRTGVSGVSTPKYLPRIPPLKSYSGFISYSSVLRVLFISPSLGCGWNARVNDSDGRASPAGNDQQQSVGVRFAERYFPLFTVFNFNDRYGQTIEEN